MSVPVGPDVVAWNLHRRYGELAVLATHGWRVAPVHTCVDGKIVFCQCGE